jgi:hypothetical protein
MIDKFEKAEQGSRQVIISIIDMFYVMWRHSTSVPLAQQLTSQFRRYRYSQEPQFDSRSEDQLSWLRMFMVFLSTSKQILG